MKRKILMIVLGLGAIAGFGTGFASLHHCHAGRRAALERHVARVCLEAAREASTPAPAPAPAPRR
jgi:hypothetical protein